MRMSDGISVPLKGWAKAVWNVLVWRSSEKDVCWPSLERLAFEAGCSVKTVCTVMDELEQKGFISRERSTGRLSTRYTLNCERASQLTVNVLHTKERDISDAAIRRRGPSEPLEIAKLVLRRSQVRNTFIALCSTYLEDVPITVPMIARELGMKPSTVRTDMASLLRNRDIPEDFAVRFGRVKRRRPKHHGKLSNVVPMRAYSGRSE